MNKGDTMDDCLPNFFKVYLPVDSGDDLGIPISFNTFLPSHVPSKVIVRSICGNIWKLKLMKCCGDVEKFVMVNGWKRIVKDEDLKGGEFLTFEFDGYRLFNVCVYGHATCKRLGNSVDIENIGNENDSKDSSIDIIVLDDGDQDSYDQDSGDDDGESGEDIIVLDDDSDEDNVSGDQNSSNRDRSSEDIIVIDDDDDETRIGVEKQRKVIFKSQKKSESQVK